MDIVMLAAGLSKRMGKTNKLLIPYNNNTMVCHSAMTALKYLETLNSNCRMIIVTGYRSSSTEKALKPCRLFIENTKAPIELIVIKNPDYRNGQFTSTKVGVSQVKDGENFFICLADMPLINAEHYKTTSGYLKNHDAVRPVVNKIPGHPVYLASRMKKIILSAKSINSVSEILGKYDLFEYETDDNALIADIDTQSDISRFLTDSAH